MLSLSKYAHSIYFKYLTVEEEDIKRRLKELGPRTAKLALLLVGPVACQNYET